MKYTQRKGLFSKTTIFPSTRKPAQKGQLTTEALLTSLKQAEREIAPTLKHADYSRPAQVLFLIVVKAAEIRNKGAYNFSEEEIAFSYRKARALLNEDKWILDPSFPITKAAFMAHVASPNTHED